MKKIKELSSFLKSNGNYAQSEILKIISAETKKETFGYVNDEGQNISMDLYHDISGGLSLNKILEMEKGCFGAYFASTSGFGDELDEIEEYLENHKDQEALAEEVMSANNEEPKSFFDKAKEMGSAALEKIKDTARSAVKSSKKQIIKGFLNAPLSRIIGSPTTRMILGHFVEGLNEGEEELDGIAIFGSADIYVVMGIQSFNSFAEIYDMCAPKRKSGQSEEFFIKCIELCSDLGITKIEMATRGSTSNAMLKYMDACMKAEVDEAGNITEKSMRNILKLKGVNSQSLTSEQVIGIAKEEAGKVMARKAVGDKFGLSVNIEDESPYHYLTKLKEEYEGVELDENEVVGNPHKFFEEEPYYHTEINLSKK